MIDDYVKLCTHLGGFSELIQGSGGNISVKSDTDIIIKSSGRILADTTSTFGYVICSIKKLQEKLTTKNESTLDCVISGDKNISPSMEVFFHLLPFKYVVHLHPTFLLKYLCSSNWKTLIIPGFSYLHIPYKTPGIDLCSTILEIHNNEQVLFLQNHGIIICSNIFDEIYMILDILYNKNNEFTKTRKILDVSQEITNSTFYIKKCNNILDFYDRYFLPITPDIKLFLKEMPIFQENTTEDIIILLRNYYKKHSEFPSVIKILGSTFTLGKSYKHCKCIEEILESYLSITSEISQNQITSIDKSLIDSLVNSDKEKHRLNIF